MSDERDTGASRRTALKYLSGTVAASVIGASAVTGDSGYSEVVDVVEEGAERDGSESITPILREHRGDDTKFEFPEGRYYMDEQLRYTGFDHVAFVGEDATIVPANYHDYESAARCFKFGTPDSPGTDLHFEGIDFDLSAEETGVRAIQAQIDDGLHVEDVTVHGEHDSGTWGPMLFDVTDPDGSGVVSGVRLPDGGEYSKHAPGDVSTGPIGVLVSRYHAGHLTMERCEIDGFPDNGLYASNGSTVEVLGGRYANSNVASIRLAGAGSLVKDATVEVTRNREDDENQLGIRLDNGSGLRVENTEVRLAEPNGHGILVQNDVESASIAGVTVTVPKRTYDGIRVNPAAGETTISDSTVELDASSYGISLRERGSGGGPVYVKNTTIVGDGDDAHRRSAVRCDRSGCEFHGLTVDQTGGGRRRALEVTGDDCLVSGGDYHASEYPIISDADGTSIREVEEIRSYDGYEAVWLWSGNSDVEIVDNTLYNGIRDDGTENLEKHGNEEPSG